MLCVYPLGVHVQIAFGECVGWGVLGVFNRIASLLLIRIVHIARVPLVLGPASLAYPLRVGWVCRHHVAKPVVEAKMDFSVCVVGR